MHDLRGQPCEVSRRINSKIRAGSGCSCTGEEMNHKGNDGKDQQHMNQKACDMEKDETAHPEKQQKNSNPQKWSESHRFSYLSVTF
jgi:hypothetical protein